MTDKKFHIEQVDMTPTLARNLLASNAENNRNVRHTRVDQYMRDMLAGHWQVTGDALRVSTEGVLMDGQHRLTAYLEAARFREGFTVPMLIAYNVNPAIMPVLDTGVPRGLHDLVGITIGANQAHLVAAIARRILQWEQGNRTGHSGRGNGVPTHTEAIERIRKDVSGFVTAASRGRDVQLSRLAPGAPSGTAFYLFAQIDKDAAHLFFDRLISGENISGSILTLRNRLIRKDRLRPYEFIALYVRTWNAWREGKTLGQVMVDTSAGKLSNQNFPVPK